MASSDAYARAKALHDDHVTLPAGLVEEYQADLRTITNHGKERLEASLRRADFDPETDPGRTFEVISEVLKPYVSTYSDAVVTRSARFFDECAKAQGVTLAPAKNLASPDDTATDIASKAMCKAKTKDAVINLCLNRFDYELRRLAHSEIYEAGWVADDELAETSGKGGTRRRRKGQVKYARVPSGAETCQFCLTLASLGFWYYSRESAGLNRVDHCHAHCDCVIVPSFLGAGMLAIPGYDPSKINPYGD